MKRKTKKLSLSKETIQSLTERSSLKQVQGGQPSQTPTCGRVFTCLWATCLPC